MQVPGRNPTAAMLVDGSVQGESKISRPWSKPVPKHRSWCRTRKSWSMGVQGGERSLPLLDGVSRGERSLPLINGGVRKDNGGERILPQAVRLKANRRPAVSDQPCWFRSRADRQKQARCLISADIKPGMQRGRGLSPLAKVRGGTAHTLQQSETSIFP